MYASILLTYTYIMPGLFEAIYLSKATEGQLVFHIRVATILPGLTRH